MNLQICFVNDSGSDKDSDADDSKTETSLDTPLSPMVSPKADHRALSVCAFLGLFLASLLLFVRNKHSRDLKNKNVSLYFLTWHAPKI